MRYRMETNGIIIVLDRGEKVLEALNRFLKEQGVQGGAVTGIGAFSEAEVGFYALSRKKYEAKKMEGDIEVVSLVGTISELGLHAHVLLSKLEGGKPVVLGGHLMEATVGITLELFLIPLQKISRKENAETGLKQMVL